MLSDPQKRRGFRAIIEGIVALVLLALAWWIAMDLRLDGSGLREIARWALGIVALGTLGYVFENGMRAFKLKIGDAEIEAGGGTNSRDDGGSGGNGADESGQ